jgi:hypothetical protein
MITIIYDFPLNVDQTESKYHLWMNEIIYCDSIIHEIHGEGE